MEIDLVVLCPDGAWPQALGAILNRPESLGIRPIVAKFVIDPLRDSSSQAIELLRPYQKISAYALIVRDFHGSGWEAKKPRDLSNFLRKQMEESGWSSSSTEVIIAVPEIESWLRLESEYFQTLLNDRARHNRHEIPIWRNKLEEAIEHHGGLKKNGKAVQPKEIFRHLLKHYGIPPSNSLFAYLGERESLNACVVPSFGRFVNVMRKWFPKSDINKTT